MPVRRQSVESHILSKISTRTKFTDSINGKDQDVRMKNTKCIYFEVLQLTIIRRLPTYFTGKFYNSGIYILANNVTIGKRNFTRCNMRNKYHSMCTQYKNKSSNSKPDLDKVLGLIYPPHDLQKYLHSINFCLVFFCIFFFNWYKMLKLVLIDDSQTSLMYGIPNLFLWVISTRIIKCFDLVNLFIYSFIRTCAPIHRLRWSQCSRCRFSI